MNLPVREIILVTQHADGRPHIAPMGVRDQDRMVLIAPFRPSTTLENLLRERRAVISCTDDVRVYAGCLSGRCDWPLEPVHGGLRLRDALSHESIELSTVEEDPLRPRLSCTVTEVVQHRPFRGFNRAQAAVLELAILASRLDRLSRGKIIQEMAYLEIALNKTAGPRELEAWRWLAAKVNAALDSQGPSDLGYVKQVPGGSSMSPAAP
ncbi:MAG: DUF447 family protein [Pirellulaceae bacterium]